MASPMVPYNSGRERTMGVKLVETNGRPELALSATTRRSSLRFNFCWWGA